MTEEKFWLSVLAIIGSTIVSCVGIGCFYNYQHDKYAMEHGYEYTSVPDHMSFEWTKPKAEIERIGK